MASFLFASCLLSTLAPGASAVGDAALGDASAVSRLTAQHIASSSDAFSDADDDSGSDIGDGEFAVAPVHVFRDPATGKLVEEVEPERREDEQKLDSAATLAAELDALYMEESVPVRGRGKRAGMLSRKSSLGGGSRKGDAGSVKGDAGSNDGDKTTGSSTSHPTAAAVSASSLGSNRATRNSRRGARRLSFGH